MDKGFITIGRFTSSDQSKNGKIQIKVFDGTYSEKMKIFLTPDQFANAVTGSFEKCEIDES